jgi:ABC-type amino acid transport substrate-binding protein
MNPNLLHVQPLNIFVSKNNPRKDEILAALNKGLQNIRKSGEWAAIVKKGLEKTK